MKTLAIAILTGLLACLMSLPLRAGPDLPTTASAARQPPPIIANFFRYHAPEGWTAIQDHPFGLAAEEKMAFSVTLHAPRHGEIPVRISIVYYAPGNLFYKSAEQYLRIFSPVPGDVDPQASVRDQPRAITVSGKAAWLFERGRKEFVPMNSQLDPNGAPTREDPRVYEVKREMMARAVQVRERFVVIPGNRGFHALRYSAGANDYQEFLPAFEMLVASFQIPVTAAR